MRIEKKKKLAKTLATFNLSFWNPSHLLSLFSSSAAADASDLISSPSLTESLPHWNRSYFWPFLLTLATPTVIVMVDCGRRFQPIVCY